jgi:hypothetical protein
MFWLVMRLIWEMMLLLMICLSLKVKTRGQNLLIEAFDRGIIDLVIEIMLH